MTVTLKASSKPPFLHTSRKFANLLKGWRHGSGSNKGKAMRLGAKLTRSRFFAAILAAFSALLLAGCEIPPSGIPTEASIRGLRPSGSVAMTEVFVSA